MPHTLAVILCTRNRAHDLERCLRSLAAQTRQPDELIVVDASDDADSISQYAEWVKALWGERARVHWAETLSEGADEAIPGHQTPGPRLRVTLLHTKPGLPAQRNLALDHAQSDVVAFFDDDVELAEDYLQQLMAVYERRWPEDVGGVMGSDPGWRQSSRAVHWLKRAFGLTHVRPQGERVRVTASLGVTWVALPRREIPVEAMPGFCMSYRRSVLAKIRFDESLQGYADGEDVDVSWRVSRRHALWQTPAAQLAHHRSRAARAALRRRFYSRTRNERYLHGKLMPQSWPYRLAWWWSVLGRVLVAALVSLKQRTPDPLLGVCAGLRRV
ncbi:MAG: glycosyltransferase family 2 protein [Chloroflexi bacterium]|nr:glycosyltransferase family 2 protein [Chloroflexota bacterium]